jgi:hypothetical protein
MTNPERSPSHSEDKNPPDEEKATPQPETPEEGERIPNLHAHLGVAWVSDDFDDELPDEFWFGED